MSLRSLTAAAVLVLAAALPAPSPAQIFGAAARVNGVEISNYRLERHFEEHVKNSRRNISAMINPKVYKKYKREALDQLIDREVLWQAAREAKVVAADEEVGEALAKLKAGFKNEQAYLRKLETSGFDEKSYRDYVREEVSSRKYLAQVIPLPAVTDDEVAAYYKENPQLFARQETARARHVLVRLEPGAGEAARAEARKRAQSILDDARKGEDFATLAERYSEDPTARGAGGDLGDFRRGQMVKSFEDAAFALKPGQISDIVETEYGFHVIKLESYTPAGTAPLAEVSDKIRAALSAQKRDAAAKKHVEELRALAKIEKLVRLED